ncbi:hypothetical protein [Bacillus ndiopicus]|uniref:hypothetical protein n=1 Tax=Bacillus ndiopicus TaxID=1347368 RepID=UPI0005A7AFA6|nr:hypothetical protein [Bacillus ndiopicus]
MLNRKLTAAFFTTVICFFIVPLFFNEYYNSYFIIGLSVSIITVPTLFIIGISFALAIELFSKFNNILILYIKHLICGLLCVVLFLLLTGWDTELLFVYTLIAFTYVSIFFINDWIIKVKFTD